VIVKTPAKKRKREAKKSESRAFQIVSSEWKKKEGCNKRREEKREAYLPAFEEKHGPRWLWQAEGG
jgi:hypothetical protein